MQDPVLALSCEREFASLSMNQNCVLRVAIQELKKKKLVTITSTFIEGVQRLCNRVCMSRPTTKGPKVYMNVKWFRE